MELEHPDLSGSDAASRTELRALARLRDRVSTAAREIERLRRENAHLAERVAALQEEGSGEDAVLSVGDEADASQLRAKIGGFIAALDQILDGPGDASAEEATPDASGARRRDA